MSFIALAVVSATASSNDDNVPAGENNAPELARTNFPLIEQATFDADLALLANVLAAKIQHPAPPDYTRDRVHDHELEGVFTLIRAWPHAKFRGPLVNYFKTSDSFVIECAQALVVYRDAALRDVVETRRDYTRRCCTGCFCWMETISNVLKEEIPREATFEPLDSLLPPRNEKEILARLEWPDGITLQKAASQLNDERLSVGLQSWAWLAERGMVAPTGTAVKAWPKLTERQQCYIAALEPKFVGRTRLLQLYDEIAGSSSVTVQARLLVRRAELGSESARAEARRVVHDAMSREDFSGILTREPGKSALHAVCAAPVPADIPTLIRLHRCSEQWVANAAIGGLCRLDHPDAINEVGEALANPAADYRHSFLEHEIQRQSANSLKHRDQWLAVLAKALRERNEIDMAFVGLIDAFECMSGREFGWNGFAGPGGVDQAGAKKTASECLRWYDDHIAASGQKPIR
jgi:hypothetical protein